MAHSDRKERRVLIEIYLPSVANLREHWAMKSKRNKLHRGLGTLAVESALTERKLPLTIRLTRISPRPLDDDNLRSAFKAFRDGIADAFEMNDRNPLLTWEYFQRKGAKGQYAVEIQFTERNP